MMDEGRESQANEAAAKMLQMILATKDEALGCDDCFEVLDRCADLIEAGGSLDEVYPQVKAHLDDCGGCAEEFAALLTALRALPPPASSTGTGSA